MDPELFQRMQAAAARFRSGETDVEEIMTPNGIARLVRDPTNSLGFRIDFVGEGAKEAVPMQQYPAAPRRPHGYPAPLPFLPDRACTVDTTTQSVRWLDLADPESAFERLSSEMIAEGWAATSDPSSGTDATQRVFEKDGAGRTLVLERKGGRANVILREWRA